MGNLVPTTTEGMAASNLLAVGETRQFVTMTIAGQLIGISVTHVEDVLRGREITPIPLAPFEIKGALNLRGRIVTAVDLRARLGLEPYEDPSKQMSVVTSFKGYFYAFLIDEVGDVLSLSLGQFEKAPPNLDSRWQEVASGVYRLDGRLLVIVDVERLLRQ